MNRVLFKAAAIVNIAAAAFIYVACSGDDGKDGANGTSCNAVANTLIGGYDIVCGGVVSGNIKDGAQGIQGPPGTNVTGACAGTLVETGVAITCNGEFVGIVTNGLPGPQGPAGPAGPGGGTGPGGTGVCNTNPIVFEGGDSGIEITCPTGETTSIIICENANGLYVNTDGDEGYCDDDGLVKRTGGLLRCGGAKYNLTTQFCQRTLVSDSTKFAYVSSTGSLLATSTAYPTTGAVIIEADGTSANYTYNRGEEYPSLVKSVVKPLCGYTGTLTAPTNPVTSTSATIIGEWHNGGAGNSNKTRVYNGGELCARNLVIKEATVTGANNDVVPGGKNDLDESKPVTSAWTIQPAPNGNENCYIETHKVELAIGTPNFLAAACRFFSADLLPFTKCPANKPLVELNNRVCVDRSTCLYNSLADNTCYGTELEAIIGAPATLSFAISSSSVASSSSAAATKIFAAPIPTVAAGLASDPDNLWVRACPTQGRTGDNAAYYLANDPNLVSRDYTLASRYSTLATAVTTAQSAASTAATAVTTAQTNASSASVVLTSASSAASAAETAAVGKDCEGSDATDALCIALASAQTALTAAQSASSAAALALTTAQSTKTAADLELTKALSDKAAGDKAVLGSGVDGSTTVVRGEPKCGATVTFEDAFDCLTGYRLSLDDPESNGTALTRPIRCIQ